ncbi:MAG: hypothetical protein ACPIOQ_01805, partial [Promethearchaeia archaeon]
MSQRSGMAGCGRARLRGSLAGWSMVSNLWQRVDYDRFLPGAGWLEILCACVGCVVVRAHAERWTMLRQTWLGGEADDRHDLLSVQWQVRCS